MHINTHTHTPHRWCCNFWNTHMEGSAREWMDGCTPHTNSHTPPLSLPQHHIFTASWCGKKIYSWCTTFRWWGYNHTIWMFCLWMHLWDILFPRQPSYITIPVLISMATHGCPSTCTAAREFPSSTTRERRECQWNINLVCIFSYSNKMSTDHWWCYLNLSNKIAYFHRQQLHVVTATVQLYMYTA